MLKSSCAEAMSNFFADLLRFANSGKHDDLKDMNFNPIKAQDWAKILKPTLNGLMTQTLMVKLKKALIVGWLAKLEP